MRTSAPRELVGAGLALALALAVALAGGCNNDLCIRHSDCDPGLVCSASGACLAPQAPDGGAGDDAAIDGALDAGLDAPDAATDAALDGAGDAAIDAGPPETLHDPFVTAPVLPEVALPHELTSVRREP